MRGNKITFAEGEGGAQLTQKKRRFKSANDWHAFCLFLSLATVLVFCCLIVSESPSMGVALVLAYTLYLLECFWLSPVARNLWKVKNQVTATELIKRLKQAAPALYFRVQSYHYELKNVTVKEGGEEKVHQIKQRVNTFNDTIQFRYGNWSDESDTVIGLENFGVVSLNLKKALHYLDRETEDQIRDQFEELQQSNRDRDDQMDSEMWTSIAGYLDAPVLCYVSDKQPFWMNWWFYALCSVLLFAWPYRIFFEATTGELTYTVRKCITIYDDLPEHDRADTSPLIVGAIKGMRGALFSVGGVLVFVALMCTAFVFVPRDPVICASLGWNGATFKTRDKGFAYTFVGSKTEEGKSTGNFFLPLHLELTMTNDNFFPVILDEVFVHVGYLTSQSDFGGAPVEIAMDKVDVTGDNNEDFKIPSRETATWKQWVVTREHGTHFLEALEELGTPKYLSCYKQESFDSKKEKEQIKSTIIERFSAYVVTKTKVLGFWTHKSTAKVPIGMDNQVKTLRIHCPSRDFARLGSHYELLEAPDASEAPEAESQRSCSNTERLSKEFEVSLASSPERETETEVDEEKVVAGALRGRPSSSGVVLTKSEGAKEADELTELDDEEEDDDDVQEEEEETEGEDLDGDLEDSQGGEDGEEKSKVAVW